MTVRRDIPVFDIGGIAVAAIDVERAASLIAEAAVSGTPGYVTVTGAHGIVESADNEAVRKAHQGAFLSVPDGMPLVWLGRLLGKRTIGRVYGPDLMRHVFSRPEYRALRHFFYGSSPAAVSHLTDVLTSRYGAFNLVGSHCPPMRPAGFREDEAVLSRIRQAKPDLLWISLSTPKQELWLQTHMQDIGHGIGIGVGAAFELVSGTVRQAPRWIQRSGLEWLFRLAMEPKRLFRRYAVIVPRFAGLFLLRLLRQARASRTSLDRLPGERVKGAS